MIPGPGQAAVALVQALEAEQDRRQMRTLQAAVDGITEERFIERITAEPRLLEMLGQAMNAARRASDERHIAALARAVASGFLARDDAEIDVAQLQVDALARVTTVHLRALLSFVSGGAEIRRRPSDLRDGDKFDSHSFGPATEPVLARLSELGALVSKTETRGMAFSGRSDHDPVSYGVTPFGWGLLILLGAVPT